MSRLVVVGDALLDRDLEGVSERTSPDSGAPVLEGATPRMRPGGAGLAAALAAQDGPVTLVAAFADDEASSELARALLAAGVDLLQLRLTGTTPEKVRFLDRGRPLMRLDRGEGTVEVGGSTPALRAVLAEATAVLVSDYGRGVAADPQVRTALAERSPELPLVWDPHPRGPTPVRGAELATPNLAEARQLAAAAPGPVPGPPPPGREPSAAALGRALAARWGAAAVCVTEGEHGATLAAADGSNESFAARPAAGDPCGAGDRFAVAAARALGNGAERAEAVRAAVAAAAEFVASSGSREVARGSAAARGARREAGADRSAALAAVARTRAAGGAVVATGGCFDLLHLGHVRTLEAARALGECLVVLLNGDRSVRELKGADRPLVGERERAETLRALACVDAVTIFDQPEPTEALSLLQPDIWCKGGDYQVDELPEAQAIATWGGRIAILPYLEGRSTTKLIAEVNERVGS